MHFPNGVGGGKCARGKLALATGWKKEQNEYFGGSHGGGVIKPRMAAVTTPKKKRVKGGGEIDRGGKSSLLGLNPDPKTGRTAH